MPDQSKRITGIYCITNNINNKKYIGQSVNIYYRWKQHKKTAYAKTGEKSDTYLYRAIRKYGIDNFSFEIIEECQQAELDEKEIYYIKLFDTYNNGYNETAGGSGTKGKGIKINNNTLKDIYQDLKNTDLTQNQIAEKYNLNFTTVSNINNGKAWFSEEIKYPIRENKNKNNCLICGENINNTHVYCKTCYKKLFQKECENNKKYKDKKDYIFSKQVEFKIKQRKKERNRKTRKTEWPSKEELKYLIRNKPFVKIAEEFGVSDKAISKWCKYYNLPYRKREINKYTDEEWNNLF